MGRAAQRWVLQGDAQPCSTLTQLVGIKELHTSDFCSSLCRRIFSPPSPISSPGFPFPEDPSGVPKHSFLPKNT